MDIFRFTDYRKFIVAYIEAQPKMGRGQRAAIATAVNVKSGYVTQVLAGKAHFSQDQIHDLSEYLNFSDVEKDYFLLLLDYARVGSQSLKKYYKKKIRAFQNSNLSLRKQHKIPDSLSEKDTDLYFLRSDYRLVHLLLTVPHINSKKDLILKTKMPPEKVNEILDFLLSSKLISQNRSGNYECNEISIHLPEDASVIFSFHTQSRLKALNSLSQKGEFDFHYSSNMSISKEDFIIIKQCLVDAINRNKETIKKSDAEIICGFCLDFFEIC